MLTYSKSLVELGKKIVLPILSMLECQGLEASSQRLSSEPHFDHLSKPKKLSAKEEVVLAGECLEQEIVNPPSE